MTRRYWFGDVANGECVSCACIRRDAEGWGGWLASIRTDMETFTPLDWTAARDCGCVRDREDYIRQVRAICIQIAEAKIAAYYRNRDVELVQMVRTLDELDRAINLLSERALEWYRVRNPKSSRKLQPSQAGKALARIQDAPQPLLAVLQEIERLHAARSVLVQEVAATAETVLPNTSALVGGLVAARLTARAGSLEALIRLPASTIQVLGAGKALFAHLRAAAPPPKHGILYQHRRVHNAPRAVRGRVARVLAAQVAIAARLDYYRSAPVPEFLAEANRRVDAAGRRA
ncbi:MAG: RNA-processing protein [Methanomicrobiales archaeon]|nr:RNA-processing protein [Methanomicrobiales archaeon]MDI6875644.1 RNA-processing protein [Methanomicrobiales archaeon]